MVAGQGHSTGAADHAGSEGGEYRKAGGGTDAGLDGVWVGAGEAGHSAGAADHMDNAGAGHVSEEMSAGAGHDSMGGSAGAAGHIIAVVAG